MMNNRLFDQKNKKDEFLVEQLLPYLLERIEKTENTKNTENTQNTEVMEDIASMYVFPYKTADGTRMGSLKEPGVSWYFNVDEEKDINSSDGYRIIDLSILPEKYATKFTQVFCIHSKYKITNFSDDIVIKHLLDKMSEEKDYSEQWWKYAYDVFKLWNENEFNSHLIKATASMSNRAFLFITDTYSWGLKGKLLKYDVFNDVLDNTAHIIFWDKLETESDKEKALEMLENMGVPHKFIIEKEIDSCIIDFFEEIASEVDFPVECDSEDYERCELCHGILTALYENHQSDFKSVIDEIYKAYLQEGMVVKNLYGEFVPLSWDLFYSQKDSIDTHDDYVCEEESYLLQETYDILETLHIDVSSDKKTYLDAFSSIHDFANTYKNEKEEYSLYDDVEEIEFYMWLWNYSKHKELAEKILSYYSERKRVYSDDIEFVLDILDKLDKLDYDDVYNAGYSFEIELDVEKAFEHNKVVNKISRKFNAINCIVSENGKKLDKSNFLSQINQRIINMSKCPEILADKIWDRVYLVGYEPERFSEEYVCCKDVCGETLILLWKSESVESYIVGLLHYISDFFDVELPKKDLKNEYINLIKGIRSFVKIRQDVVPIDKCYKPIPYLNDIKTFEEEKMLWLKLKQERRKFFEYGGEDIPLYSLDSRNYLKAKYNGRCQLCGNITPKNIQDSYFYTYRMVKQSENELSGMRYNLFCLCPTCHGELGYGKLMGQDLSEIKDKASEYAQIIEKAISECEDCDDDSECFVKAFVDIKENVDGFKEPIVCNVTVNGKERKMVFSWEHFIRIAFVFSDINNFDKEDDLAGKNADET